MGSHSCEAKLQPQAEWRELKAGETFLLLLEKMSLTIQEIVKEIYKISLLFFIISIVPTSLTVSLI